MGKKTTNLLKEKLSNWFKSIRKWVHEIYLQKFIPSVLQDEEALEELEDLHKGLLLYQRIKHLLKHLCGYNSQPGDILKELKVSDVKPQTYA